MAHHKSAIKRWHQSLRERDRNRARRTVARGNGERDPRVAALKVRVHLTYRADGVDDGEISRGVESGDEVPARGRMIAIGDDDRHVLHVGRGGVAEHRQLDDRRDDDEAEQPRVLAQLEELFPHEMAEPLH